MSFKDPATRLNNVYADLTRVNANASTAIQAFVGGMANGARVQLSNHLSQGKRWSGDANVVRRRALMRAVMLTHLVVDDIAPATLRQQLAPLSEIALQMRLQQRLQWIEDHAQAIQQEAAWGVDANCYAYAADCNAPVNGNHGGARPGQAAGVPAIPGPTVNYQQVLLQGAIADGAIAPVAPGTLANPPNPQVNRYLIALLSHAYGFHFLRRDEATGHWSWKDGNGNTVKQNVHLVLPLAAGTPMPKMWRSVTDDLLPDLCAGRYSPWIYGGMPFRGFLEVPNGGFLVQGPP